MTGFYMKGNIGCCWISQTNLRDVARTSSNIEDGELRNNIYFLAITIFAKLSILDVCGGPDSTFLSK